MAAGADVVLTESDLTWVRRLARKAAGRRLHPDDAESAACWAALKSALRAGDGRLCRNRASVRIAGEIRSEIARSMGRGFHGGDRAARRGEAPKVLSLDAGDSAAGLALAAIVAAPERPADVQGWGPRAARPETIRDIASRLPSPHRAVIAQLYGLPPYARRWTAEAVARGRGWGVDRVRAIEAEALAMLRRRLAGRNGKRAREAADAEFLAAAEAEWQAGGCDRPPSILALSRRLALGDRAVRSRRDRLIAEGRYPYGIQEARARGEAASHARLTEADIPAIRSAVSDGESYRSVGYRYGISAEMVRKIVHREKWGHVA